MFLKFLNNKLIYIYIYIYILKLFALIRNIIIDDLTMKRNVCAIWYKKNYLSQKKGTYIVITL